MRSESWRWKDVKQRWRIWRRDMERLVTQTISLEITAQPSTRLQPGLRTRKNLLGFRCEADPSPAFNFGRGQNRASAVNKNSKETVINGRWNFPGRTYLVLKMILYLTSEFLELESGYKMLMFIFLSLYSKVVVVSGDRKSVV